MYKSKQIHSQIDANTSWAMSLPDGAAYVMAKPLVLLFLALVQQKTMALDAESDLMGMSEDIDFQYDGIGCLLDEMALAPQVMVPQGPLAKLHS